MRDGASDSRLEITVVAGGGVVGAVVVGGIVASGLWFEDSLTCLIVLVADLYPWITMRPKPEIAWIAERMKITVA